MLLIYTQCGTINLEHGILLGATLHDKILPVTQWHKLPMILYGAFAGNHSHCRVLSAAGPDDAVSQHSFLSSGPYSLPIHLENEHLLKITAKAFILPRCHPKHRV